MELRVQVLDRQRRPLEDASVTLRIEGEPPQLIGVPWDPSRQRYVVRELTAGSYTLVVEAVAGSQLEPQQRALSISNGIASELFILGEFGLPAFYRGRVRVPFVPLPDLLAIQLRPGSSEQEKDAFREELRNLRLVDVPELPPNAAAANLQVVRRPFVDDPDVEPTLRRLEGLRAVVRVGALVLFGPETLTFLTDRVAIRFREPLAEEALLVFAAHWGLERPRKLIFATDTWQFRFSGGAGYRMLENLQQIILAGEVEWAEPDLVTPPSLDAIHPTDFLWPGQWDHMLVKCPEAWQALQDAGLPEFGDPNLILAIIDDGVQSAGGVSTHPDFQGTVSNGQAKVAQFFDFVHMQANNDLPRGNHGMAAAGVALANANNPAPVAGPAFGIAGAAPNVRMMSLIYDNTTADSEIAEMFLWAAGFDPVSATPDFPAPLSEGAAILSSSIGFGEDLPLAATTSLMLDFLATSGRGGKGCLCFFSAGNANKDLTAYRPYAAHPKSFGITASTLKNDGVTEMRAGYSCFGECAKLCAPSDDRGSSSSMFHNPPFRYATWGATASGPVIAYPELQTSLSADVVQQATLPLLTTAGLASGSRLMIGAPESPGQEPASILSVDSATSVTLVNNLMNPHPAGTLIYSGPGLHQWFGGTSSATPLAAGVAALVLSANPELSWSDVFEILRTTAEKIAPDNTDPIGHWRDEAGARSVDSGLPPIFSQWFGFGRIDAAAAVNVALRTRAALPADDAPDPRRISVS